MKWRLTLINFLRNEIMSQNSLLFAKTVYKKDLSF